MQFDFRADEFEARRGIQFAAMLALGLGIHAGVRRGPAPEKYAGQRKAYLCGAWRGDGSRPEPTRQMRRAAARRAG